MELANKSKYYFTGKPCKHGHVSKRWAHNGVCYECCKESRDKWVRRKQLENKERRYFRYYSPDAIAKKKQKERLYKLKYQENNYEKVKESWRAASIRYRNNHPERSHDRRIKEIGAIGSHAGEDLIEILKLQRNRCAICTRKFNKRLLATIDHIIALVNGGTHYRQNIQYLCKKCNCAKGKLDMIEFSRKHGRLL